MIVAGSIGEFFALNALTATISLVFAFATPYVLASLGETFGQRSGVYNLGVDGVMLLGAFAGYYTVLKTKNVWLGCLVAIGVGLIIGLVCWPRERARLGRAGHQRYRLLPVRARHQELLFEKWVKTPLPIKSFPEAEDPAAVEDPAHR